MSAPYTDEEIEQHLDELDMLGPNAAYLDTGSAAIIRQLRAERRASERGTVRDALKDALQVLDTFDAIAQNVCAAIGIEKSERPAHWVLGIRDLHRELDRLRAEKAERDAQDVALADSWARSVAAAVEEFPAPTPEQSSAVRDSMTVAEAEAWATRVGCVMFEAGAEDADMATAERLRAGAYDGAGEWVNPIVAAAVERARGEMEAPRP